MLLSEFMAGKTPNPSFTGEVLAKEYVTAIDISPTQDSEPSGYVVLCAHIESTESSIDSETQESNYYAEGKSTIVTNKSITVSMSGHRLVGDNAQDFLDSYNQKFAVGEKAIVNMIRFCYLNGKGWKGRFTATADKDSGGDASSKSEVSYTFSQVSTPTEFEYTAPPTPPVRSK